MACSEETKVDPVRNDTAAENRHALLRDLAAVLNKHSTEGASDTPDFILADYLVSCLEAWNAAVRRRQSFQHGMDGADRASRGLP